MQLGKMSFSNLFPSFFKKNPSPSQVIEGQGQEQPPPAYPWSVQQLHLLPPAVSVNNLMPGTTVVAPGPPPPPSPPSPSPFPRYGHSLGASTASPGDLYLLGGLVDGLPQNDLYLFRTPASAERDRKSDNGSDSDSKSGGLVSATLWETSGEIPSPRVNHASALVASLLIAWGGDTNASSGSGSESQDQLDDGLYLLNLVSREWTRVTVHGPAPSGRYGHAAAMIGSSFFVFGGQVDGVFFNDLWAFDMNTLRTKATWELYEPVTEDKPAPRSGHSCIAHGDKIILFGGTDGTYHYGDTWAFDTKTRTWSELQCIGYIPASREGHAVALVGDVMYVSGGRGVDGKDLGDIVALNIPGQRWYMFQHMGPGPSARRGHAMASVGDEVFVLGGESSTSTSDSEKSDGDVVGVTNVVHVLNTKHITYPLGSRAPPPNGDVGNGL